MEYTAKPALTADVEDLGAQPVADIHHRCRKDLRLLEEFNDILPGLGFQQPADDIFLAFQIGLHSGALEEDLFLPFEQDKPDISRSQVARTAEKIAFLRGAAPYKTIGGNLADGRDRNDKPLFGRGGIAADKIDPIVFAGGIDPFVKLIEGFDAKPVADADAHRYLRWCGIHRIDITQVDDHRLVAQMLQRRIHKVEVNVLDQQIGRDHRLPAKMVDNGGIIPDPNQGRGVLDLDVRRKMLDQSKFSHRGDLSPVFAHSSCYLIRTECRPFTTSTSSSWILPLVAMIWG